MSWSPNRQSDEFLIYRELLPRYSAGNKKLASKDYDWNPKKEDHYSRSRSKHSAPSEADPALIESLGRTDNLKDGGLEDNGYLRTRHNISSRRILHSRQREEASYSLGRSVPSSIV